MTAARLVPATLETARLCIRPVEAADLPALLVVNGDEAVTRHLPYPAWRHLDDARAWLDRIAGRAASGELLQCVIAERDGGGVVGSCLLFRLEPESARAELGYVLGRAHWGRGLMHEAMQAFVAHAFGACGLRRLDAVIDPRNAASARVLERLGFVREGLLRAHTRFKGELTDTALYGRLADDPPPAGRAPADALRSPQSLAAHAGPVSDAARRKEADHLHPVYRRWIEAAPYAVLATVGPEGLDASPRGDPAPLVRVVDERTLWLPERRGNNRLDSVGNLVRDPRVALLFLVPGVGEALRVNGRAWVRTDPAVRAACATAEAEPAFVIEVRIERVYFQHERAARRAGLWAAGPRPAVPDAAAMLAALAATPPDGPGTAAPPRPAPGGDGR